MFYLMVTIKAAQAEGNPGAHPKVAPTALGLSLLFGCGNTHMITCAKKLDFKELCKWL
jgi:hypothetical protein